jgi:hypothetical protein
MRHWTDLFSIGFYKYLFSFDKYSGLETSTFSEKLNCIICRFKLHPNGPVWYSNGFEPDMSCRDCGEEL